jgi:hypothetical protein
VDIDNNFVVGGGPTINDYHKVGDVVKDGSATKICTAPGWTKKDALTYYFTATAANDYVVITSPGDPAAGLVVGQKISLPGAGTAGGTLTAIIRRLYVASAQYRILLSTPVVTSVASSTALSLEQTATYIEVPPVSGSLIKATVYRPGTVAVKTTTSTSFVDVDATNLVTTFVAPASEQCS